MTLEASADVNADIRSKQEGVHPLEAEAPIDMEIKKIDVRYLSDAYEHIQKNCPVLIDIDGTMMTFWQTLRFSIRLGAGADFDDQMSEHFRNIRQELIKQSGLEPIVVTNRVFLGNAFMAGAEFIFNTLRVVNRLTAAGFNHNSICAGLDRQAIQSPSPISQKNAWDKLLKNLHEQLREQENKSLEIAIVADNLNILGPFVSEINFAKEVIRLLRAIHPEYLDKTFKVKLITIKKKPVAKLKDLTRKIGTLVNNTSPSNAPELAEP